MEFYSLKEKEQLKLTSSIELEMERTSYFRFASVSVGAGILLAVVYIYFFTGIGKSILLYFVIFDLFYGTSLVWIFKKQKKELFEIFKK